MRLNNLAIFGGPAFLEKLHVGRPNIANSERFIERTRAMLARRWLSNNGPLVQECETAIAIFLD